MLASLGLSQHQATSKALSRRLQFGNVEAGLADNLIDCMNYYLCFVQVKSNCRFYP